MSLLKYVTSASAVGSIAAVSILASSCSAHKNNNDSTTSDIVINNQSPDNQDVSNNNTNNLNLFVNASCNGDNLTYQWYVNKDGTNWTPIAGATQSTYDIPKEELNAVTTKATWQYKAEIKSEKDSSKVVTSNIYSVKITPEKTTVPWKPLEPSQPITPTPPTTPDKPVEPDPTPKPDPTPPTNPNPPSQPSEDEIYNTPEVPTALKFDYDKVASNLPSTSSDLDFVYQDKITKRYARQVSKEFYETDLQKKYANTNFKYPSYNYNYESGSNRWLQVGGQSVDIMTEVYNERVKKANGESVKYNDTGWIREQIEAGTLKKHPAARFWYEKNVGDDTQGVDKHFTISTPKNGNFTTGLYAPAGEIITLTFDDDTFELIKTNNYKGIKVVLNDNYWDNYPAGNSGQISNRYPFLTTSFSIDPKSNSLKFGSPFGGSILIDIGYSLANTSDALNYSSNPISFTISGAVESLNYVHGYTTEDDWNRQIQAVVDGTITAPNMQAMYSWASMNIPFTGDKKVAGVNAANIKYPYEVFKKWNNFHFLSAYMARSYTRMFTIKFCDDLWNDAGGVGGGHNAWVPISWARGGFLSGLSGFTIDNSWGLMHEINHSYQQDNAYFHKNTHPETNQVTMASLALLSDTGSRRSESNYNQETSGWAYVSNSYATVQRIISNPKGCGEYPVYSAMLFAFGAKNYMDYMRYDAPNRPSNAAGWNGMKEIRDISDWFKLDFWPAFENLYPYWNDNWPSSYETASEENKGIIDTLKSKYSSVDFVGNLYAAGSYMYNSETKQYVYTGDVVAPFEITTYEDYNFDFGKYINSVNKKFTWSKIKIPATSKNGVSLKTSGKSVIYSTSEASITEEPDEFDISIIPDEWDGKPSNYVTEYKWKVKVKCNFKDARVQLYTGITSWDINSNNHADEIKKYSPVKSFSTRRFDSGSLYVVKGTNNVARIKFSVVAPKAGTYIFKSMWNSSIAIYANNQKVFTYPTVMGMNMEFYRKEMKANEVITFDAFIRCEKYSCTFDFEAWFGEDEKLNLNNIILGYDINKVYDVNSSSFTYNTYFNDPRFKTKLRYEDYTQFIQSTNNGLITKNSSFVIPSRNLYTLKSLTPGVNVDLLYDMTSNLEIWKTKPISLAFQVDFKQPTQVGSLKFGHRTDNHPNMRPTDIKVTGTDENGQSSVLYDGSYSSWYSSRSADSTIVNLNKVSTLKSMKIELTNKADYGLVLKWFTYSSETYLPLNNNVSVTDSYIAKTDGWSYLHNENNQYNALSPLDNRSLYTTTKYAALDFNLKNARGFRLVGTTLTTESIFDVYIDGKIYQRDVRIGGTFSNYVNLFRYVGDKVQDNLRVTIVNKSANPLIIGCIQTYSDNNKIVMTSPTIVSKNS